MSRPSDWHVLELDRDPTPGDPARIRAMARSWQRLGDDAASAHARVRSLLGDGAVGAWIGEAGDAFRAKTGDLPEQLQQCADSYHLAADALRWWSGRLAAHQGDADAALARGRVAREEWEEAKRQAAAAAAAVGVAAGADALRDTSTDPTPEQVRDAQARLRSAQATAGRAHDAVAAARARLDAAKALALDAQALRESDGRVAAARVHEAADAGIPERSRWERFKDWAGEAWDVVVTVAKVVVAVLGVVALIIGGPLAWVVFAAAVLVLADTVMKYLQGEASLWEVAFAALACIPMTKGLTSLSALRAAFAEGGALGAGVHVLGAGRAALVEMAAAVRQAGSGFRQVVVSFLSGRRAADAVDALRAFDDIPTAPQGVWRTLSDPALDEWLDDVGRLHPELPRDGIRGIWDYTTDDGYSAVNAALRGPGSAADTVAAQERIAAANLGLDSLPAFEGTTFRGTNLPDAVVGEIERTGLYADAAFSSTSLNASVSEGFADLARPNPTLMTIDGVSGVNVAPFSAAQGEVEILFRGGTRFEVLRNVVDAHGVRRLALREVP